MANAPQPRHFRSPHPGRERVCPPSFLANLASKQANFAKMTAIS
ncbi:hypothetical protein BN2497_4019 [Janthinobacterium sp. CG23_2]|nr:hypothetical protein BN2497_4019 [Janthinobacterium sp. CG23_2]CUU28407.1 hypothetical protein BN3177_4019 [Janthinobacterium sp. CG23_2]